MLLHFYFFCFHLSLVIKKTNQKMITNITFKNCSFKIGINKIICVMIWSIAAAVFLVILFFLVSLKLLNSRSYFHYL